MTNLFNFLPALAGTLIFGFAGIASASDGRCDVRLTVELTPDVPDESNPGFISSLLSNHPEYQLDLLRRDDPSLIELELFGPGPDYRCHEVIETMRRDARVVAVRVDSAEQSSSLTAAAADEDAPDVHLSRSGLGSLYWAAQHPQLAWMVLLPIRAGKAPGNEVLKERDSAKSLELDGDKGEP